MLDLKKKAFTPLSGSQNLFWCQNVSESALEIFQIYVSLSKVHL